VQYYINQIVEARNKRTQIDQDFVVRKLKQIVDCDYYGTVRMTQKEFDDIDDDTAKLIQGVKIKENIRTNLDGETISKFYEVTFMSKDKAIECLAKHTGTYEKDNKQMGQGISQGFASAIANLERKK